MSKHNIPEMWGGMDCSLWRRHDVYHDQLQLAGHYNRGVSDVVTMAELGLSAIRYPVLFERHVPGLDFSWAQLQLETIRMLGILPIVGLVHHGCGPRQATLPGSQFVNQFEEFACEVALQFPWLTHYALINEPLTTARFSGLYGKWYPHRHDALVFVTLLLCQLKAVAKAMHSIRQINPQAVFIQTEDLGKVYSTPELKYQADFENERRWLTYDILCGRFDKHHALWDYFRWLGVNETSLWYFADNPQPPDILGLDYYVTSERFLDHRLDLYPHVTPGGNGRHRYVDVEAIRVPVKQPTGLEVLINECWARYKIPMALTEVHIGCTAQHQAAWFAQAWEKACNLRQMGIPLVALCAWSLFGAYGWNTLLTESPGRYEAGAIDIERGLVKTPYFDFLKSVNHNAAPATFDAATPWWQADDRYLVPLHVST